MNIHIIQTATTGNTIGIIIAILLIVYVVYHFIRVSQKMNKPPSANTKILSDENFSQIISNGLSLVDFWAAWCQPCKVQGPIIDEIADEIGKEVNICKLDIDHNRKTASMLGIRNIPTMLLFKDGQIVERFVGVKAKHVLINKINHYR